MDAPEITDATDITRLSATQLSAAIHARHVSCHEVMLAYLHRIADKNPVHNAIVSLRDTDALIDEAKVRDAQLVRGGSMGWMHGMPQAIKDLALTAGIPTTLGSPLLADFVPTQDSLMVERMKAAGCIVIGKTNTPEFGLGSHTFNEVFGATRNAYDPTKTAGGSSGGAAVALALGMLPVADGSDFMGSLRNPAAYNNVFGFRPSQGRVPGWPAPDAYLAQLGTEGPMGRSVADVTRLLAVQAGHDARVPLSLDGPPTAVLDGVAGVVDGRRVGWLADLGGYLAMEPGIIDACEGGLRRLESLGCHVEPVTFALDPARVWETWLVWRRLLVSARLAPYARNPAARTRVKPEALWEYDQAQGLRGEDFVRASEDRTAFYLSMLALFERFDVLAIPTAQVWPFDVALRWPTHIGDRSMDTYHRWMEVTTYATLAGLPAISVPVGLNDRGLPMGMQLIGRPRGDDAVLELAHAYEQAAPDLGVGRLVTRTVTPSADCCTS